MLSIICTPTFITELCAQTKMCKQPACPSTDEWINKMWCRHKMKYYSVLNENKMKSSNCIILSAKHRWLPHTS